MKKKPKKRYLTAQQIMAEIDRYKSKIAKLEATATMLDIKADELFKAGPELSEDATYAREQAKKSRRSATRIMEKRLPHLKEKLAEFQTEIMDFVHEDRSVQA